MRSGLVFDWNLNIRASEKFCIIYRHSVRTSVETQQASKIKRNNKFFIILSYTRRCQQYKPYLRLQVKCLTTILLHYFELHTSLSTIQTLLTSSSEVPHNNTFALFWATYVAVNNTNPNYVFKWSDSQQYFCIILSYTRRCQQYKPYSRLQVKCLTTLLLHYFELHTSLSTIQTLLMSSIEVFHILSDFNRTI